MSGVRGDVPAHGQGRLMSLSTETSYSTDASYSTDVYYRTEASYGSDVYYSTAAVSTGFSQCTWNTSLMIYLDIIQ